MVQKTDTQTLTDKLFQKGLPALSDAELLSILIANNKPENYTLQQARTILNDCNNNYKVLERQSTYDLQKQGLTKQQSVRLLVSQEISRRSKIQRTLYSKISSSKDVYDIMQPLIGHLNYEEFWILCLNRSNKVVDKIKVSQGGINGTVIDVKLILKAAIDRLASSIILCHNHPSRNISPSENDQVITIKIEKAAKWMDIQVLDHIIITCDHYHSFADDGQMGRNSIGTT